MTGGLGALCSSDHDHVWRSASYYALSQLMEYAKGTSMQTSVECETYDMPGYAIDDTPQYRGKENVPYVDSASAWDRENGRLNLFVLNRNEESEYSLTVDVRGFEGYRFVKQFEMYTDDLEASSSFDNPSLVLPKEKEDILKYEENIELSVFLKLIKIFLSSIQICKNCYKTYNCYCTERHYNSCYNRI
jgi:alpha-N-arabinofuranosidase